MWSQAVPNHTYESSAPSLRLLPGHFPGSVLYSHVVGAIVTAHLQGRPRLEPLVYMSAWVARRSFEQ